MNTAEKLFRRLLAMLFGEIAYQSLMFWNFLSPSEQKKLRKDQIITLLSEI